MNDEILLGTIEDMDEPSFEKMVLHLMQKMGLEVERHRSKPGFMEVKGKATLPDGVVKNYHVHFMQHGEDVTPREIQKLSSRRIKEDTEALFITTGEYSEESEEYAQEMGVRLADGESVVMLLEKYNMAEDILRPFDKQENETNEDEGRFLPSVAELHEHMENGVEYYDIKKYKKALGYFEEALKLKPNYAYAWRMKAKCLFEMGNDQEAIDIYKQALSLDVKNPEMWFELAEMLYELEKHDEELECYEQAIELDKKFERAWNNRGATLFELGNIDMAIESFQKAVDANPGFDEAWHNMGLAYKKKGEYKESRRSYYKALSLNKDYLEARISLINLLNEMQKFEESSDQCHIALNQTRKDHRIWYLAAMSFKGMGNYNKAIYCTEQALEITPGSDTLRRLKADLNFLLERYGDEIPAKPLYDTDWEESLEEKPEDEGAGDAIPEEAPVEEDGEMLAAVEAPAPTPEENLQLEPEGIDDAEGPAAPEEPVLEEQPPQEKEEYTAEETVVAENLEPAPDQEPEEISEEGLAEDVEEIFEEQPEKTLEDETAEDIEEISEEEPEEISEEYAPPHMVEVDVQATYAERFEEKEEEPEEMVKEEKKEKKGGINVFLKEIDNILLSSEKKNENLEKEKPTQEQAEKVELALPPDFEGLARAAKLLYLLGKSHDALDALEKALATDEKDDALWLLKGNCLFHMGRTEGALEAYNTALRINPRSTTALLNREAAFHKGGYAEEKTHTSTRLTELRPELWQGWALRGMNLMDEGEFEQGVESLEQSISLREGLLLVQNLESMGLLVGQETEEALDRFTEMVSASSTSATGWCNRGVALYARGLQKEAIQAFDKAINIHPNHSLAWSNRGVALYAMGDLEEASASLDTAIVKDRGEPFAWLNRGILLYKDGDMENALEHFHQAVSLDENLHLAWYHLSMVFLDMGKEMEAKDALSKAVELAPEITRYHAAYGSTQKGGNRSGRRRGKPETQQNKKEPESKVDEAEVELDSGEEEQKADGDDAKKEKKEYLGAKKEPTMDEDWEDTKLGRLENNSDGDSEEPDGYGIEKGAEGIEKGTEGNDAAGWVEEEFVDNSEIMEIELVEEPPTPIRKKGNIGELLGNLSSAPPPPPEESERNCPRCGIEITGKQALCPLCGMEL
ncbi:MAG: tetratricopeptide repeat protein [Candidatus Thermoplasmatota archaeon]|nr:tetratricopeptide repeat protein [Candidatus Thermoplasmatota archaeon]